MTDKELENELKKAWNENKKRRDICSHRIPTNKDMNLKRTHIKKDGIRPRVN
ncbi:MAG: hypothetical protein ACFFAS_15905 [Promethearchaeota archaeon]